MNDKPIPIEFRAVSIPKATIDRLLKTPRPKETLSLYLFYYYTAIWQATNTPCCTTSYAAKGLKCSISAIRRTKKQLASLGLIKDIQSKNNKGRITGWFIRVFFYEGTAGAIKNPPYQKTTGWLKKPTLSENYRVEQWGGNAYSTNNKNDAAIKNGGHRRENLFDLCPIPKIKDTPQHRLSLQLYIILKQIVPAHNKGMPQKNAKGRRDWRSWHQAFNQLLEDSNRTEQDVSKVIQYYKKHIRDKFIPKLYSATTFCKEIHRVEQLREDSQQAKPLSLSAQLKEAAAIARNRQVYKWTDEEGRRFIMWPSGEWRELGKNATLGGNIFEGQSR